MSDYCPLFSQTFDGLLFSYLTITDVTWYVQHKFQVSFLLYIATEKNLTKSLMLTVLPYIKGVTEPLKIILNNNGIRATTRPVKTLQQEFASPKSRSPSDRQTNVVYKIPCADGLHMELHRRNG